MQVLCQFWYQDSEYPEFSNLEKTIIIKENDVRCIVELKGKTDKNKWDKGKRDKGKPDKGKTDKGKTHKGKIDKGKTDKGKTDKGKIKAIQSQCACHGYLGQLASLKVPKSSLFVRKSSK